jgi:hypothetical protein
MADDKEKVKFITLITSVVLQYGVPFAIDMIKTWGVDKDVTLDDIKALGSKMKQDEPFLQT